MVVRRSVSVPDDLATRMDQTEGVNWSALAQMVWAAECKRYEGRPAVASRIEVLRLERLAHLAQKHEASGYPAGLYWAENKATYEQLLAVGALDSLASDESAWAGEPSAFGWAVCIADALWGDGEWTRGQLEEFSTHYLEAACPEADVVRGFIEGASEWFDEHRHLIDGE